MWYHLPYPPPHKPIRYTGVLRNSRYIYCALFVAVAIAVERGATRRYGYVRSNEKCLMQCRIPSALNRGNSAAVGLGL